MRELSEVPMSDIFFTFLFFNFLYPVILTYFHFNSTLNIILKFQEFAFFSFLISVSPGANFKGKLQERQQRLGLPMPTYTLTQDGNKYQYTVTVVIVKGGTEQTFVGEMAEGGKKNAEHRAARKALESLGKSEKQSESAVKSSADSNPMPHKPKMSADSNPRQDNESADLASPAVKTSSDSKPNRHKPKSDGEDEPAGVPGKLSLK